jgi:hypothetical protein
VPDSIVNNNVELVGTLLTTNLNEAKIASQKDGELMLPDN